MSLPDHLLDLPGDPYCGACGCCHPVGDPGYACADEEAAGDAIDAAELLTQER